MKNRLSNSDMNFDDLKSEDKLDDFQNKKIKPRRKGLKQLEQIDDNNKEEEQ